MAKLIFISSETVKLEKNAEYIQTQQQSYPYFRKTNPLGIQKLPA